MDKSLLIKNNEVVRGYYLGVHNNPLQCFENEYFKLGWCAGMFDGHHLTKSEAISKLRGV